MRNRLHHLALWTALVVVLAPVAAPSAETGGATLWNPLTWGNGASSKKTAASKRSVVRNTKSEPSTWDRMTRGTKSAATATKHTLLPWTKPEPQPEPPVSGSRAKPKTNAKQSSWWPWGTQSDDDQRGPPQTIVDWIGGERPGY